MKKEYVRANVELVDINAEKTIFSASMGDQGPYWCEEFCTWDEYILLCTPDNCYAIWNAIGCQEERDKQYGDWVDDGDC